MSVMELPGLANTSRSTRLGPVGIKGASSGSAGVGSPAVGSPAVGSPAVGSPAVVSAAVGVFDVCAFEPRSTSSPILVS